MSRADFERGWRCAIAEVARRLRSERDGIHPVELSGEMAAQIAESVRLNVGVQRGEVSTELLELFSAPGGCRWRPTTTAEKGMIGRMLTGGQVKEGPVACTYSLTARGRSELLDD